MNSLICKKYYTTGFFQSSTIKTEKLHYNDWNILLILQVFPFNPIWRPSSYSPACHPITPPRDSTVDATFFFTILIIVTIRADCNKNSTFALNVLKICWWNIPMSQLKPLAHLPHQLGQLSFTWWHCSPFLQFPQICLQSNP